MRVTTTIEGGPVATMPSDQVNAEFSHQRWTNFSGLDTALIVGGALDYTAEAGLATTLFGVLGVATGGAFIAVTGLAVGYYYYEQ